MGLLRSLLYPASESFTSHCGNNLKFDILFLKPFQSKVIDADSLLVPNINLASVSAKFKLKRKCVCVAAEKTRHVSLAHAFDK